MIVSTCRVQWPRPLIGGQSIPIQSTNRPNAKVHIADLGVLVAAFPSRQLYRNYTPSGADRRASKLAHSNKSYFPQIV
jgi:hypothetical protein